MRCRRRLLLRHSRLYACLGRVLAVCACGGRGLRMPWWLLLVVVVQLGGGGSFKMWRWSEESWCNLRTDCPDSWRPGANGGGVSFST